MTSKETSSEQPFQPGLLKTVHLTREHLNELMLRLKFATGHRSNSPFIRLTGAVSIPRLRLALDQELKTQVDGLLANGRLQGQLRLAQKAFSPATAGNLVLREESGFPPGLENVSYETLVSVLNFFANGPDGIQSIRVLPNASDNQTKVNGVVIDFTDKKRWWRGLASNSWPLGRGLLLAQLGLSFDEFCSVSERLLAEIFTRSRKLGPVQGIKYTHFLNDQEGNMFILLSAGPNRQETKFINERLMEEDRQSNLAGEMIVLESKMAERRLEAVKSLISGTDFPDIGQVIFNEPYISLNTQLQRAWSGGTIGHNNGLSPLMPSINSLDLLTSGGDEVVPLGGRLYLPTTGYIPQLPPGVADIGIERRSSVTEPELRGGQQGWALQSEYDVAAIAYHVRMRLLK